jgi:hypothetical protein
VGFQLIQPSFTGGELSPSLYGRVDIARYQTSVRLARNFIVRPYGGLTNRPGLQFVDEVKDSAVRVRLIPFVFSTGIAYVVELGDLYARFYANGAQLAVAGTPVEVATPWTAAEVAQLTFTQSADVIILAHPAHPPQRLRRLTATTFELSEFETRDGPFSDLNTDESRVMAASAADGVVTITANADVFLPEHVGALVYLEAKDLSQIRPWMQGDRSVTLGALRRSEGKTYRASDVPTPPSTAGENWTESGSLRPIHEVGRVWDGAGDTRSDGTNAWKVGVEWEYIDAGYGIARIQSVTNARVVVAVVTKRLPQAVIGGVGAPAASWAFTGDGTTRVFDVTGATAISNLDYRVTIAGVPVQSDPYYSPSFDGGLSGGVRGGIPGDLQNL